MEKTESPSEIASEGRYLQLFLYMVPKKNHDAIAKNLKLFVPWFEKNGVSIDYYQLGSSEKMEGMEDLAMTLSAAEDEDVWMELQYFRDREHCEDTYSRMMQDKHMEQMGKEFFGLITQGKSLVMGGFTRLGA